MTVVLDRALLENNGVANDVHYEDQSCTGYDYGANYIAVTTRYDDCDTETEVRKRSFIIGDPTPDCLAREPSVL